jgi:hypothetical protein
MMFENLLKDTAFPSLISLIDAADKSLEGVKQRLTEQRGGGDHITAIAADQQLNAIAAWEPMLREVKAYLDSQITHTPATHPPTARTNHER